MRPWSNGNNKLIINYKFIDFLPPKRIIKHDIMKWNTSESSYLKDWKNKVCRMKKASWEQTTSMFGVKFVDEFEQCKQLQIPIHTNHKHHFKIINTTILGFTVLNAFHWRFNCQSMAIVLFYWQSCNIKSGFESQNHFNHRN